MSTPRLSLVMGGSASVAEGGDVSLPLPESGTVHLHLHLGEKAGPAMESVNRSLGGWGCLIVGLGLMGAFGSGYQLGHRPAPDDVSNLRPMPALGSLVPPEPAMPSVATVGLPAIQRQLATPPQIIPPTRVPQAPVLAAPAPAPAPNAASPTANRNAFGLEN
jgi:hypothetical protein